MEPKNDESPQGQVYEVGQAPQDPYQAVREILCKRRYLLDQEIQAIDEAAADQAKRDRAHGILHRELYARQVPVP